MRQRKAGAPACTVWLVGESNPYQAEPRPEFDLYPDPPQSAGARLCRILGYDPAEPAAYLDAFERRNLLYGQSWSVPAARESARKLIAESGDADALVLLGGKVSAAFGLRFDKAVPWTAYLTRGPRLALPALVVPHPSGLSRSWDDPTMAPRVRAAVEALRGGDR